MGSIAKCNLGVKQFCSQRSIPSVDVYNSAKYSVDVSYSEDDFFIIVVMLLLIVVYLLIYALGSVTIGGSLVAAMLVKVYGLVLMAFFIMTTIYLVTFAFTTKTTAVTEP